MISNDYQTVKGFLHFNIMGWTWSNKEVYASIDYIYIALLQL